MSGFDKVKKKMKMGKKESKIEALKKQAQAAASDIKRREIITAFYEIISTAKEVQRFNEDLQENIYINSRSLRETRAHASKFKTSTLAVLDLLEVMQTAKKVSEEATKENVGSQKQFEKIIILKDYIEGIGEVKLTVGVTKADGKHIQYCLTAVE